MAIGAFLFCRIKDVLFEEMSLKKILIVGGRVIDPATGVDKLLNVAIVDGRVAQLIENDAKNRVENVFSVHKTNVKNNDANVTQNDVCYDVVIDAGGCLVVPGLIDVHAHVYEHATELGVDPDSTCLARGPGSLLRVFHSQLPTAGALKQCDQIKIAKSL